jgi:YbgC/YbaW family acyl-CoA thioester hydrolase
MPYEFKLTRRVEFVETDAAGIMHFSNYFRLMEAAEQAFLRSLGVQRLREPGPRLGWPRVHAECTYKKPLMADDLVEIHLLVCKKEKKSLSYSFAIYQVNEPPGHEVARGSLVVVCVVIDPVQGSMSAVTIPREIESQIELAPARLLPE